MRRLLAAALLAGLALALPGSAGATVVPQRSIMGIRLGMTVKEVRTRAGMPDGVAFVQHPIIGRTRVWRYGRTRATFDGDGPRAKVINVDTTSRRERLANAIGVGSTRRSVRTRVARVHCDREPGLDHCWIGEFRAGRTVTDFRMRRGRVARIVIGIVVD
jgi:hypothetical protein